MNSEGPTMIDRPPGDLLETYCGLLEDLDENQRGHVFLHPDHPISIHGRAADAIRHLAGEVARLRAELAAAAAAASLGDHIPLAPCPACVRPTTLTVKKTGGDDEDSWYVECQDCHASGPWSETRAGAIARWNVLPR